MLTSSVAGFLRGDLDPFWKQSALNLYKEWFSYALFINKYQPDSRIYVDSGVFIDPDSRIMSFFSEHVDISGLLGQPHADFTIDSLNAMFTPNLDRLLPTEEDRNKVLLTDFPFINVGPNLLSTYNKKKRWKFQSSLKLEGNTVNFQVVEKFSIAAIKLWEERWTSLNGEKLTEKFCLPVALVTAAIEWRSTYVQIYNGTELVGIAIVIHMENNVSHVVVFNSIKPCLYSFVSWLNGILMDRGGTINFGASFAFSEDATRRFTYKNNIANAYVKSPYVFSGPDSAEIYPPYFSTTQQKWVIQ